MGLSLVMIDSAEDDDSEFLEIIELAIASSIKGYEPTEVFLVKIDSWFDSKWLNFGGKVTGDIGANTRYLLIPEFHPNRVEGQKYFRKSEATKIEFVEHDSIPIHIEDAHSNRFQRVLNRDHSSAIFVWYSGKTKSNKRGSLMVFWVKEVEVRGWYDAFKAEETWTPGRTVGMPREAVLKLLS